MSRLGMGWRLAHLPWLLVVTGAVLVLAAVAGGATRGGAGAAGAAIGVGVVAASYLFSTLLIAWGDSIDPQLVLPFGLGAYLIKFSVIGIVMASVAATDWAGLAPMGVGVVAGVIGWTTAQIWWVVRHPPRLEYHPPASEDAPGGGNRRAESS